MSQPLLTFFVVSYKQERFIREAVAGAFAQTYSPLEIILSDDASSDRTFEIMQEMAGEYRGPHKVVLNRNPKNLGIGAHVNRVVELANGELLVGSAGDDCSLPGRTEKTYQAWEQSQRRATSIFSSYTEMSEDGKLLAVRSESQPDLSRLQDRVRAWNVAKGCAHAFSKTVFREFGPLSNDVCFEDAAINFRSWAFHPVLHVTESLVHYRIHGQAVSSISAKNVDPELMLAKQRWFLAGRMATFKQYLKDLDHPMLTAATDKRTLLEARRLVIEQLRLVHYQLEFASAGRAERFRLLAQLTGSGLSPKRMSFWFLRAAFPRLDEWNLKRASRGA